MNRFLPSLLLALVMFLPTAAQEPAAKPPARPAATPRPAPLAPATRRDSLPSRELVESFLRRMFGYDPSLKWQLVDIRPSEVPGMAHVVVAIGDQSRATHLYVSADSEWAIVGDVLPFGADPFVKMRRQLDERANGPSKGPKDASITIVEFTDLQCPSCKNAEPTLQKLLAEVPSARFVVQPFPLTQIHPWAMKAARWGHCIGEKDAAAYFKFSAAVYEGQAATTEANADEKLRAAAATAGMDAAAAAQCANLPATEAAVRASMDLGQSLGVSGTPTLFVNGRKIAGLNSMPYDSLKAIVQFEVAQSQKGAGVPAAKPAN